MTRSDWFIVNFCKVRRKIIAISSSVNTRGSRRDGNKYGINDAKSRDRACYISIPDHFIVAIGLTILI